MRLAEVATSAKIRQARCFQPPEHLDEGAATVVTRMVVGQRDRIDMPLQQRQHARLGAEGPGLAGDFLAALGDHAFKIGQAQISAGEQLCKRLEGVATAADQAARAVGQHHVANPGDAHHRIEG